MRIQVITRDNGFGLTKDIQVLREALEPEGHEVVFTPWDRPRMGAKFHWNIHLELLNPIQLRQPGTHVFVPNPEWMQQEYPRYFSSIDLILAKTRDCEAIMRPLHGDVRYVGWTSPDPHSRVNFDKPMIVHAAGDSAAKGTQAVIEAMAMAPEARAIVIWKKQVKGRLPENVQLIGGHIPQERFAQLREAPIHLCPSSYEGFGHYVNEARAMGAVIITTNAAPMNELITDQFGYLASVCSTRTTHAAKEQHVCPDVLAQCIRSAWGNVMEFGPTWGKRAREVYERERTVFTDAIRAILQ